MKHPLDGRSYRDRIGRPYYGEQLRRVISPEPTDPPFIERWTEYYWTHHWPSRVLFAFGLVIAASVLAAWIVS
jgi:hypothetical protein